MRSFFALTKVERKEKRTETRTRTTAAAADADNAHPSEVRDNGDAEGEGEDCSEPMRSGDTKPSMSKHFGGTHAQTHTHIPMRRRKFNKFAVPAKHSMSTTTTVPARAPAPTDGTSKRRRASMGAHTHTHTHTRTAKPVSFSAFGFGKENAHAHAHTEDGTMESPRKARPLDTLRVNSPQRTHTHTHDAQTNTLKRSPKDDAPASAGTAKCESAHVITNVSVGDYAFSLSPPKSTEKLDTTTGKGNTANAQVSMSSFAFKSNVSARRQILNDSRGSGSAGNKHGRSAAGDGSGPLAGPAKRAVKGPRRPLPTSLGGFGGAKGERARRGDGDVVVVVDVPVQGVGMDDDDHDGEPDAGGGGNETGVAQLPSSVFDAFAFSARASAMGCGSSS